MNLNQVTVPSIDLSRSVSFYKKLGLTLIVDALPNYARFECPQGDASFSIHRVDQLPSGNGVILYFECENLEAKVHSLKTEGILFQHDPVHQEWLWQEAKLLDPDGNQLILFHAGKNRLHPPWRIQD